MKEMAKEDLEALNRVHEINYRMLVMIDEICKKHHITYFLCWGALIGSYRYKDFIPWDNDVDLMITRKEFDKLLPILREELDPNLYELVMPFDYGDGHYFDMVPHIICKTCTVKGFSDSYNAFYKNKANKIALDFFFIDRIPDNLSGKITVTRLKLLYGLLNGKRHSKEMSAERSKFLMTAAGAVLRNVGKLFSMEKMCNKADKLARKYENDPGATTLRVTNETLQSFTFHFPERCYAGTKPVPIRDRFFPAPIEAEEVLTIMYGDYMTPPPEDAQVPHIFNRKLTADLFEFSE